MSPATAEAVAPVSLGPGFFHEAMPLEQLQRSPLNPRKRFGGIEELAQNIREIGILQPLVARPVGDHYELVAGERRYRAAKLAGLETVPCTVRHLTDAQALEIMVIENNQREDVNALEEADGFSRLLKSGYELERLAERLGRSKKYVYDRMKLLDLAAPAKELLSDGVLTAGHGILLARLKPADQMRALDVEHGGVFVGDAGLTEEEEEAAIGTPDERAEALRRSKAKADDEFSVRDVVGMKPKSVRETARWIYEHVRFKPHEMAVAAPLEFGEVAERVDLALLKPGRGKKVIAITFNHYVQPEARDESERTFGPRSFKFADGKPHRDYGDYGTKPKPTKSCEHSVLGVVAVGEKYGQAFDVCIARDKCQVHWKSEIDQRAKNQKSGKTAKVSRGDANSAHEAWMAKMRREREESEREHAAWDAIRERALERLAAALKKGGPSARVIDALMSGHSLESDDKKLFVRLMGKVTAANIAVALLFADIVDDVARDHDEFVKVAKVYGVDLADLTTEYKQLLAPKVTAKPVQTSAPKTKSGKKKR